MRVLVFALVTVGGLALPGGEARAQRTAYYGDAAAMTGGSGMALYRGGGASWYNPAGLVGNRRSQVDLTASVFILRFRDAAGLLETRSPGQVHVADLGTLTFDTIPSSLVFKRRLSKRVHAAVGLFVTEQDSWSVRDVLELTEPFGGSLSRYYQRTTISSKLQTYHLGGMVSWEVTPRLRLGWGLFGVYSRFSYEFRDLTASHLEDEATSELTDPWLYTYDVSAGFTIWGLRLTMGLQWELPKGWHLGLLVRSPTLVLHRKTRLDELLTFADASAAPGDLAGLFLKLDDTEEIAALTTPMEMVAGLAYRSRAFFVGLEGELQLPLNNFSTYLSDITPQWNLRAGGRVFVSERIALGAGLFTERSLHRTLLFVGDRRMDFYGGTIGLKWRKAHSIRDRTRNDALVFTTTIALRYAYGTGSLRGYINDLVGPETGPVDRIHRVHELALYLGSSLYF